ncbi:undecaprenyl/decaprenyl-phosphate alpha-N-acetylglucosaminyl 1-phosphate transferase [Sulfurimonas aquatica]|uniref:Undecaprenyl/decaprenyl-phosphate alpha-N-acetylglucosaminyl 1-phosphate transferase n=1 Tax=Sulfurimonas aquatica TaxID=2672570 RepID=A0A975GD54_9BACT|nr:MraY family glycosyltransferase [Sulfurimonas aquatica]QSZ42381.1 undecaprenyl/decaprenyl-phosphate alpha-N-acetylglucosaminyl 1-phosphate transferase [Sulfurimonas aquatica]
MYILELLAILIFSYFSVKLLIKYAHALDLVDIPNERSHHCDIIPSGAGIGFILTFFVSMALFEFNLFIENACTFLAIFLVFLIGIVDDRIEVSAKLKFVVIFLAVFVMSFDDMLIFSLGTWYGYDLVLPWFGALLFSMFALAGFTNALNLIDGIDGLSSSVSIVILLFFAFLGVEYDNHLILTISTFTIAVILGFLFLNWNPAHIFMGDSGSLSLGFIISVLAVMSLEHIHPISVLYLAAIPLLDTLIVMVRRIRRGKSPFSPDKTHIHHIVVKFFDMNVKRTVFFLSLLQVIFSSIGYMILDSINKHGSQNVPLFALLGFILMFVLFYMIFTGMQKRQLRLDKQNKSS